MSPQHAALIAEAVAVEGRLSPTSLTVPPGGLHALTGPNGAGKSTLLACLAGLLPHAGAVTWQVPGRLALVPQRLVPPSFPLRVDEFLALAAAGDPALTGAARQAALAALARVQATDLAARPLAALSMGQLKRVVLAQALTPAPAAVLLDEPEAGLDEASLAWLDDVLASLRRDGVPVLWVTHDAARAQRLGATVTALTGAARA